MSEISREEVLQVAALIMSGNTNVVSNCTWVNTKLPEIIDLAEALVKEVNSRNYSNLSKYGIDQQNN